MVTGSSGRRTIPSTTRWGVLDVLESGLDPCAALGGPRSHRRRFPIDFRLEDDSPPEPTRLAMSMTGPTWKILGHLGTANSIVVDLTSGEIQGAAARGLSRSWTARKVTGRN